MVFGLNVPGLALDRHALQQAKLAIALRVIGQDVPKPQQPFFLTRADHGVVKAPVARLPQGGSLPVLGRARQGGFGQQMHGRHHLGLPGGVPMGHGRCEAQALNGSAGGHQVAQFGKAGLAHPRAAVGVQSDQILRRQAHQGFADGGQAQMELVLQIRRAQALAWHQVAIQDFAAQALVRALCQ